VSDFFGGNKDAEAVYELIKELTHTWDDLVDKDKPVNEYEINRAFAIPLLYLPLNPFYRSIQDAILPMWEMVITAYETANHFERIKDPHGVEIGHNLRYAAGHIVTFMCVRCVGYEKAREILPDLWKDIVFERYDEYLEGLESDNKILV